MGKRTYCSKWEKSCPWIYPVENEKYTAYCKICIKSFRIEKSVLSQVESHAKCHK